MNSFSSQLGRNELYMNLRTDFAFKRLFGSKEHSHLLIRFLNSIFKGEKVVTQVEFKDKEVLPPDKDGKRIIYDAYCTTDTGEHFILEMQNIYEPYFENRALIYTVKALTGQLKKGNEYRLDPVYSIFITNFEFEHLTKGMAHEIGLIDKQTGEEYSDIMKMLFIPMASVKEVWEKCENEYERIVFLIKNIHTMDKESEAYKSGEYDDFFKAAEINLMAQEDVVTYSNSYRKMEENQRAIEYAVNKAATEAFSKGEAIGISKGQAMGLSIGLREAASNLKKLGLSPLLIAQATGLSTAEIDSL